MSILITIGLILLAIIIIIGIIRIIFNPYTGIVDLILDLFLLDLAGDALGAIFEAIGDVDWGDW